MRHWVLVPVLTLWLALACLLSPAGAITISGGGGGLPTVPCPDVGGNHLNFDNGAWICGTSSSGGTPGNAKADGVTKGIATFTTEFTDNGSGLIGLAPVLVNHTLGNTNTFLARDDRFTLQDDADITRQARFQLGVITPGQTRTFTLPNIDATLATLAGTETFTNKTLSGASNTITNLPETALTLTDITTANATTLAHGFLPKLPGGTTAFLRADGTFAVPPGAVSSVTSVFGRTGAVVAQTGDYSAAQVLNAADLTATNTFTHPSGQSMARLTLPGTTSGTLSLRPPTLAGTSVLTFPAGSIDFTTTGGPGQVVRQSTVGAPLTVSQLTLGDITGGANVCTTSVVCAGYQGLIPYVPEDSANKATSTALGTSNIAYPSQNAVKVYVDGGLAAKQGLLGFTPEDAANKAQSTALGTSTTAYPSQNAVKVYVDNQITTRQATVTWGDGLAFTGSTASVASTETNFLTNGVATPLACGLGATGRAQVLANGEFQYCDGAGTALLRSGLPTQSGLTWNVNPSACTGDANGGKLSLNPAGTQIVCASDIAATGGPTGVTSVFGRTGVVVVQPGDYTAAQVTNAADLTVANTFTHPSGQTVARLMLALVGGGTISLRPPATVGSSIVTFPSGSIDFSATGGTNQVVRQSTLGGPFTVSQLTFSDLAGQTTQAQLPNLNMLNTGLTPLRCVETDATGKFTVAAGLCGTGTGGLPDTGANGFVVRSGAGPTTVARSLQGTALQIQITNPTGVGGDPIIGIAPNPTLPGLTTGSFSGTFAGNATTAGAFDHDPAACPANQFAIDQAANGLLGCAQPTFAMLAGVATAAQLPNAAADGTTKGVVALAVADFECTAGACSLDYTNGQTASGALKGFLSAADWNIFNNKQAALGFTPENIANKATATALGTSDTFYPSQNAVKSYVDNQIATRQATVTWGDGLAFSGATASTASQEAHFLADGGVVDLTCGAGNFGKMQVMDNGTLQYCDGATTSVLQIGRLTPATLTWNVTAGTCTADGNAGKLTVNASNQIVCDTDRGGVGGIISVGNCTGGACFNGTSTASGTTLSLYDGDSHAGTLQTVNLTAARTYSLPNESGTLCTSAGPGTTCSAYQAALGFTPLASTRTLTITGTANQVVVTPTGPQDLAADRNWLLSLPQNIDNAALVRHASLGLGVAAPATAGLLAQSAAVNNVTLLTLKRFTDAAPTGAFVDYQSSASASLWRVDITGALTAGDVPWARLTGIPNAAADGATKGIVALAVADFECTTGLCSLDYANGQAATSATKGFLTAPDWITFNAKQAAVTWGDGLAFSAGIATVASQEAHFLADGGVVDLVCGAGNFGKMQVLDNGTLQYCDGATTSGLQTGRLTPTPLTWNVTAGTCTADGNAGKLTVNASNQIVCDTDRGGTSTLASAFDHDPAPCPVNQFATDQSATGALGCAQPASTQLSDTANLVRTTGAQKVSGKQNVPREVLYTPAGAPLAITPGCDTADMVVVNAIAGPLTINDPGPCTGTNPEPSQELTMRLFSTASQALTFSATGYSAEAGVPFPAATTGNGSTYDYLKFIRNSVTSRWDLVAVKALDKTVATKPTATLAATLQCNINTDRQCQLTSTAAGGAVITIETPLGSPNDGDMLMVLLLCQNVQPIAHNPASFIASPNIPLPTSCPNDLTRHTVMGYRYSAILSKYQILALN